MAREQPLTLAPTARLARAERRRRAEARRAAGETAWTAEPVLTLSAWIGQLRDQAVIGGAVDAVPIAGLQARALWEQAIDRQIFVGEPRVAELAERAWRALHEYRLEPPERWPELILSEDARAFRQWAGRYRALCEQRGVIDEWRFAARLPELIASGAIEIPRRIEMVGRELPPTPLEATLFEALESAGCEISGTGVPKPDPASGPVSLDAFSDPGEELEAAAAWARRKLEADPETTVGIVVPDLGNRLEAVDRIFRRVFDPPAFALTEAAAEAWHVSLGPALSAWPLIADALVLLQLDPQRLTQAHANRLLGSPWLAGWSVNGKARAEAVRRLMDRAPYEITATEWARESETVGASDIALRIRQWQALRADHRQPTRPSDWVARFQAELETLGFGRGRGLNSREYQALNRWHELLESYAALDVVADAGISRGRALSLLAERAGTTRFRERDPGCPVEVLGVEEALGSRFDALWITTLDHETWPKPARRDPLIPASVQAGVPASTADGRLARARAELAGLLRSAPEVRGSLSIGSDEQPREPTPLLPGIERVEIQPPAEPETVDLEIIERDVRAPALDAPGAGGGTGVLRDQSACPFRAFAARRLGAAHPQPPRPGLDAAARGSLIHRALELFWDRLDGRADLLALGETDLEARTRSAAESAIDEFIRPYRHRLGAGARVLEQRCTARALARWLAIERRRGDFRVIDRELAVEMQFGPLRLTGKIDRIDETAAGTVLLDYKTGRAGKSGWTPDPRMTDPQLPAYALALDSPPAGLAFARLAPDAMAFDGLAETDPEMPGVAVLSQAKRGWKDFDDWAALLGAWRRRLEALAGGFVDGRAEVDPRDLQVCRNCGLHALCRIDERQPVGRWLEDGE